jgi:hypothetical protein
MKSATVLVATVLIFAPSASAVDFLGVELCAGSSDTSVALPPGSGLVLESAEIGDHGGLVLLLSASRGKVMDNVDDLMTGLTGRRGEGDNDLLQWSAEGITALAQKVGKKYAALAVTSADECGAAGVVPEPDDPPDAAEEQTAPDLAAPAVDPASTTSAAAAAAVVASIPPAPAEPEPDPAAAPAAVDFEVVGAISHERADPTWIDVMGVVANHTANSYKVATFDLSLFAADGGMICVDTISVNVLKAGQERAFRDAIRCSGYSANTVAEIRLQFSGGF